jgi:MFS family permease
MKKSAFRFIVLLGIVSLFADFTYEGARGIIGPYLANLGATGSSVGWIVSVGALIGYGMRIISGYLSDRMRSYWFMTILGYGLTLVAVPLLALTHHWMTAAFLIIVERFGKALRSPPRDAMLSYATKEVGRGWGFGVHEALDQIGAVLGPLFIAFVLFLQGSYQVAFACLAVPAALAFCMLLTARVTYPSPEKMEKVALSLQTRGFSKSYWLYIFAVGFVALGYADFALISYHFQKADVISPIWISLLYAIAMGVDGIAALVMGKVFDLKGIFVLAGVTLIASLFAPLVFLGSLSWVIWGMVLWGIGLGAQESIMRSVVASLVLPNQRGTAYGLMNLVFGVFWAIGSIVIGFLYDISSLYVTIFCLVAQWISVPLFLKIKVGR